MPRSAPRRHTSSRPALSPLGRVEPQAPEGLIGPLTALEWVHAPKQLFIAGDRTLLRQAPKVAIVGSRKASEEGVRRAAKLARQVVRSGIVAVSGLAEGVDTAAHAATIEAGGRTIAVIGTPLDQAYPRANAELQAHIARHHLLVSQFAPGATVRRFFFPMRNCTMALIVDASVIVEAEDKSGSLSLGWETLRLRRPLFIMKSILDRGELRWPRRMLGYGAQVLEHVDDLLEVLRSRGPAVLSL